MFNIGDRCIVSIRRKGKRLKVEGEIKAFNKKKGKESVDIKFQYNGIIYSNSFYLNQIKPLT